MKANVFWLLVVSSLATCSAAVAEVKRAKFTSNTNQSLIVETLDDDLVHFELSAGGSGSSGSNPLYTSPMIDKTDYSGPTNYSQTGNVIETSDIRVNVNPQSLCIAVTDKVKNADLTTICPLNLNQPWKGLTLNKEQIENVYGLGQQFKQVGSADGDWIAHGIRAVGDQDYGNRFMPFGSAGVVGDIQFPILYGVGRNKLNYALFLDNVYKQSWDFRSDPWSVQMWGDQVRFYIMTGQDLPDLRKDYLELVGQPPVPPKKAFGLWVSEFGYKNWTEVEQLKSSLRTDNFPIDGFALDLYWFGGVIDSSPFSPMGRLNWYPTSDDSPDGPNGTYSIDFRNPEQTLANFANDNIGFITIEESYINLNTDTYAQMIQSNNSFFAYEKNGDRCDSNSQFKPIVLSNLWLGQAAMVDWSNPQAGAWIHDNRRFPNLVEKGIVGHWTDLGEPERYNSNACYKGVEVTASGIKNQHGDVHNLYNLLWNESIYEGYVRRKDTVNRRPFILSRSGAPGSQRFGVAIWSGDIGSNLDSLATSLNTQMHMSFSGIDYYGSDIGGFRREGMPYNENHSGNLQYQNELYTQWFASGAWFDVPVRPHTNNLNTNGIRYATAPNLIGKKETNLANLKQRYELIPYYYSLAHRAFLFGEPVIAPLVFYYQNDANVRQVGHQKLIGKDLMVGVIASHGQYQRDVYLPQGKWINYHTHEWFTSSGDWLKTFPNYIDGVLRLPTFARAGAIVPMMYVDEQTKDVFGDRQDNTTRNELVVKVYADTTSTTFTLYEDDGSTVDYDANKKPIYQTRTTNISQQKTGNAATVVINKSTGSYQGAATQKNNIVQLVVENAEATNVTLNGMQLTKLTSESEFNAAASGWYNAGRNLILAKSGIQDVSLDKTFQFTVQSVPATASVYFVCDNGWTNSGESIYVVGNNAQLGNWDVNKAIKLNPDVYYEYMYAPPPNHKGPGPSTPKWTGLIQGLPTNSSLEWKCAKKLNSGQWQWESGANNRITTLNSAFSGMSLGSF